MAYFTHPKQRYAKRYLTIFAILAVLAGLIVSANIISIGKRGSITADGGTTYYVDSSPTASDSNKCSIDLPCRQVNRALTLTVAGDTIVVKPGAYSSFKVTGKKNLSAPITIKGESSGTAVISGSGTGPAGDDNIYITDSDHIIIQDLVSEGARRSGIYTGSSDHLLLRHNILRNNTVQGILTGSLNDSTLEYNEAFGANGPTGQHGIYVSGDTRRNIIRFNVLHDNARTGFHLNGSGGTKNPSDVQFYGNIVYNNGIDTNGTRSAAGIQVCGDTIKVYNNLVYNDSAGGIVVGQDACGVGPSNIIVANNTVVGTYRFAINIHNLTGPLSVLNNIFYAASGTANGGDVNMAAPSDMSFTTSNYNLFVVGNNRFSADDGATMITLAEWQSKYHQELNSQVANLNALFKSQSFDPLFADYHLRLDSPAIDVGVEVPTASQDLSGIARPVNGKYDIGAYEYVPPSSTKPKADLVITKVVDKATPQEGDMLNYTVSLTNNGPDQASGAVVHDALPSGITFVSAAVTKGAYDSASKNWTLGALSPHLTDTLILKGKLDSGTASTTITNSAAASQDASILDDPSNNTTSVSITVAPKTTTADLQVGLSVDNATPKEGDNVNYSVKVTNKGPNTASSVVAKDSIPAGLTFVSSTGSYDKTTGVWTIGSLTNGASATLTLKSTVNGGTNSTTITNSASVTQDSTIIDPSGNNSASISLVVTNVADLGIAKSIDNVKPKENDTVTYIIKTTNFGPNQSSGVIVKDALPASLSYVSSSQSSGSYDKSSGNWSIGNLNANASASLTLKALVNQGTNGKTITNDASVSESSNIFDAPGNNSMSVPLVVTNIADIGIAKSLDNVKPKENDTITYTLKAKNFGPSTATNVSIKDSLPSELAYASSSPSAGSYDKTTGTWSVGDIKNGDEQTLRISAIIRAGTIGKTVTNSATATESTNLFDSSDNNTSSVSLTVADKPCTVNCNGGSAEPSKGKDIAPPGSGQGGSTEPIKSAKSEASNGGSVAPGTSTQPASTNQTNAVPKAISNARIDVSKSYVRVDGNHIVADGKSEFRIIVGIKDKNNAFITNIMPKALFSGADVTKTDPILIGNEWSIGVRSNKAGSYVANVSASTVALGNATLTFLPASSAEQVASTESAPSFITPPSPAISLETSLPIRLSWWERFRISIRNGLVTINNVLLSWFSRN